MGKFSGLNYLLFDAIKARRWSDKFSLWFRRTGWRPADVEAQYPKNSTSLERFQKFDPPVSTHRKRYVFAQFVVVVVLTLLIADAFANHGARFVLVPCVLLWAQLYALGLLNEGRSNARRVEAIRLAIITPLGLLMLDPTLLPVTSSVWAILATYILVSLLWLRKS